jgi:1-acyl-sn-glycerol-3-phosphate acyltransferase
MREAFTRFFRFAAKVFFRRIEVVGLENIPPHAPVIFAVNHPNGLVDPLFVLCFAPRPVSFLAKAPLFRYPLIGWFARTFEGIPVYRKQDNVAGSNRETFARSRQVLAKGGAIAIFPEGTTHSDARLKELKTGAARIALGAGLPEIAVIPTGIYYTEKYTFRSDALVWFGEPIAVQAAPVDEEGEPAPAPVEQLTRTIERRLAEVTLQADSHAALDLVQRAERIFTAGDAALAEELEIRKRFVDGYLYLCEHDRLRLAHLESEIARFESELHALRLDPETLRAHGVRVSFTSLAILLVLLPIAVAAGILNYPTYRLIGALANRFSKRESEMTATLKFIAALLLYPLTWIAIALAIGWRFGPWPALAALLAQPLGAWLALRVSERLDEVIGRARALVRRRARNQLLKQRERLREEFLAVAAEMNG